MARNHKQPPKIRPTREQVSRSPADKDFTCSEVQLDNLLSEGESTGPSPSKSREASSKTFVHRRKST